MNNNRNNGRSGRNQGLGLLLLRLLDPCTEKDQTTVLKHPVNSDESSGRGASGVRL